VCEWTLACGWAGQNGKMRKLRKCEEAKTKSKSKGEAKARGLLLRRRRCRRLGRY